MIYVNISYLFLWLESPRKSGQTRNVAPYLYLQQAGYSDGTTRLLTQAATHIFKTRVAHGLNRGFLKWGTPKSSIEIGFSTMNHHFGSPPLYGNPQMNSVGRVHRRTSPGFRSLATHLRDSQPSHEKNF